MGIRRSTLFLHMRAVGLRQQGKSLKEIHRLTKVPESTLSDWFKYIKRPEEAEQIIQKRKRAANVNARHASWIKAQQR